MTSASRPGRRLLAAALAFACAPAFADSPFSSTVFFGDSLTDAGTFRPALIQFAGPEAAILGRFTTNPDLVWAEWLAGYYGGDGNPANQGGDNYAVGGARTGTDTAGPFGAIPSVTSQVQAYLAANGGRADADALYTVWAGANDLFAITDPSTAPLQIGAAVTAHVTAIGTLQAAGARYVLVPTVPDLGLTPAYTAMGQSATGSQLSIGYNSALFNALAANGLRVIPLDTFGLLREVAADPGRYGFANVTGTACQPQVTAQSLTCNPGTLVGPDAPDTYLFADGVHPTGAAHEIVADFAVATIEAPRQVALLPHAAQSIGRSRAERVRGRLDAGAPADGTRWWADVRGDVQRQDEGDAMDGGGPSLTLGVDWTRGAIVAGLFAGIGRQDIDFGDDRGEFEQRDAALGGFVGWRGDGPWVQAQASYARLGFDVDRVVQLGPATRVHEGSPDGTNLGVGLAGGWRFDAGALSHGPVLSVLSQRIEVDGYAESADAGSQSSALAYPEQSFDSLVGSVGWEVEFNGGAIRPYARATWDREFEDAPEEAFAMSQSIAGALPWAVPAHRFDEDYATVLVGARTAVFGLDADLGLMTTVQNHGNDTTVFATVGGRF
ncbi:autotransporter domain-containing protein [Luteimonas pelagia]